MGQPFFYQIAAPDLGLDKYGPATMIEDRRTPNAQNVRFRGGTVYKRMGYRAISSAPVTSTPVLARGFARLDATTTTMLATLYAIYRWTGTTWTAIKTGLSGTPDGYHSACIINDTWIYTNGRDHVQKWTGSGNAADLGGGADYQTPAYHLARAVVAYSDRLLLLGTNEDGTDHPYRIRWSELSQPEGYDVNSGGGYADLTEDPSGIQGAELLGDNAAIYGGNSIWLASYIGEPFTYRFNRVVAGLGCPAPRTICLVEGTDTHVFMGDDDVYIFTGQGVERIGREIRTELFAGVSRANRRRCFGTLNPDESLYYLYVPYGSSAGSITRAYIYDFNDRTWTMDSVANMTTAATVEMGSDMTIDEMDVLATTIDELPGDRIDDLAAFSGTNYRVFADSSGYTYQDDGVSQDDTVTPYLSGTTGYGRYDYGKAYGGSAPVEAVTAIDALWDTKDLALSDEYVDRFKRVHAVMFEAKGSEIEVWYSTDHGENWKRGARKTLANDYMRYRVDVDAYGRQIRLRFRNRLETSRFWLRWIGVQGMVEGDR